MVRLGAMKRVLSGNSLPDTTHFKNLLEQSALVLHEQVAHVTTVR